MFCPVISLTGFGTIQCLLTSSTLSQDEARIHDTTVFHEFTLAYNKLNKWLCVFGVLSEERAPSSVIVPEPGVLPWPGERGPSSPFSPDPKAPPPYAGEETGWK